MNTLKHIHQPDPNPSFNPNKPPTAPQIADIVSEHKLRIWWGIGILAVIVFVGLLARNIPLIIPPTLTFTSTYTSAPITFQATVSQPSLCHNGPNKSYLGAITISAGTVVEVLAINSDSKDWFMIQGDSIDTCWIESTALYLSPAINIAKLIIFNTVFTIENTPCRTYPGIESAIQTVIPKNWRIVMYGKSDQKANWVLAVPHDSTELCWAAKNTLSSFNVMELDIVAIELTSTPTFPPTGTSSPINTLTITPSVTKHLTTVPISTRTREENDNPTPAPPTNTPVPPTPIPPTPIPPTPIPPTPIPPTEIPPTPTLCWPPGKCK